MSVLPLEPLSNPADGGVASASNFGTPVYDYIKATTSTGNASGIPDTNGGAPIVTRSPLTAMTSYTNAIGIATYPGISPISGYQGGAGSLSYTVPNGNMLVVNHFVMTNGPQVGIISVNDLSTNWTLASVYSQVTSLALPRPLLLDQNWILTVPQYVSWNGYLIVRDTALTPIVKKLSSGDMYTVPVGKTLMLNGAFVYAATGGAVAPAANVMLSSTPIAVCTTIGTAANLDSIQGIPAGHPPVFQNPSVLSGSSASTLIGMYGVLI